MREKREDKRYFIIAVKKILDIINVNLKVVGIK